MDEIQPSNKLQGRQVKQSSGTSHLMIE